MGEYYEVTGTNVTKYYGGSAMRVGGTLYYLLSDHLGSNSLILDTAGNVVGETRYTAWGEERYSSGSVSTDYTYTGQYSNTDDFGLMYYKARWYDPVLGRFAQADSIVPGAGNPLAWDRYAYVNNNPVRYADPTGHCAWDLCIGEGVVTIGAGTVVVFIVAVVVSATAIVYVTDPTSRHAIDTAVSDLTANIETIGTKAVEGFDNILLSKGEYIPPGLTAKERQAYRDAVHRYKDAWGIKPNQNVSKKILDQIAEKLKDGMKPVDAADEADGPHEKE